MQLENVNQGGLLGKHSLCNHLLQDASAAPDPTGPQAQQTKPGAPRARGRTSPAQPTRPRSQGWTAPLMPP